MPINQKWYSFTDEVVSLIPEKSGVYELGNAKTDVVVYIGSSESSIRSRLREHRKMKRFMKVSHFRFKRVASEDARNMEAKLVADFKKAHKGKLPRLQGRAPVKRKSFLDSIFDF